MSFDDQQQFFVDLGLFALTLAVTAGGLMAIHRIFLANRPDLSSTQRLPRQLGLMVSSLIGLVLVTLSLPVSEGLRNQILGLIGVLLSGLIAFSSTTIVGNLMAGLMLRVTRPFKIGDFIRIQDNFGRVTELGLLDTEIQTEQRQLIHMPNSYLISHPINTTRSSGTIISVELSLGFDVHHRTITPLLHQAAERAELEDGFVQILAIGDFSVTYRISGLLTEVNSLISAKSRLMAEVLDCLHEADIEILSPTFMAQRPQPEGLRMIPKSPKVIDPSEDKQETDAPEEVVFDKAEEAAAKDEAIRNLETKVAELHEQLDDAEGENHKAIQKEIADLKEQIKIKRTEQSAKED